MDQTLHQLGELLLGSIPTIIFLILLYFFYRALVHAPLAKVLRDRHDLTEGAVQRARADIAAAETKSAEYEHKLREATLATLKARESRRQAVVQAREAALAAVRAQAHQQVVAAKAAMDEDAAAARGLLQLEAERLASEIMRRVLQPIGFGPSVAGGGAR